MLSLPQVRPQHTIPKVNRKSVWTAVTVLSFCMLPGALAATRGNAAQSDESDRSRITAIRFWSLGDVTRIAIESTGEFRFNSDRLDNPDRLFFDLMDTKPRLGGQFTKGTAIIPVHDALVRQIRVAETQKGVTRVVLDLNATVEYSTAQLANPDRLIIELHPPLSDKSLITSVAVRPMPVLPPPPPAPAPEAVAKTVRRPAVLDFTEFRRQRLAAMQAREEIVFDPPSPFDFSLRFATRPFNKPDPLQGSPLLAMRAIPPPLRIPRRIPAVLAKVTPPVPDLPVRTEPLRTEPVRPVKEIIIPRTAAPVEDQAALPAKRNPEGDTMTRILGLKLGRVVIDAGHGGHDSGTLGPEGMGLDEKDVALDVAKRLGTLIQERLGSEVIYTRTDDTFIPLSRRPAIANENKADLFLSIHVNSSPVHTVAGYETYYLSLNGTKSALDVASRENAGADKNIADLQDLLKKIALQDKAGESREFASDIQSALTTLAPKSVRTTRDRGVKKAPFVVLIGAQMPAVLAEIGFISNSQDANMMRHPEQRQKIAEALYKGVASYANSLSHFQVAAQSSQLAKGSGAAQ